MKNEIILSKEISLEELKELFDKDWHRFDDSVASIERADGKEMINLKDRNGNELVGFELVDNNKMVVNKTKTTSAKTLLIAAILSAASLTILFTDFMTQFTKVVISGICIAAIASMASKNNARYYKEEEIKKKHTDRLAAFLSSEELYS